MSTRANIVVMQGTHELMFYQHSDGYPDGVLPTLDEFMKLIIDKKIRRDIEQASGWLIVLGKVAYDVPDTPADGIMGWKVGAIEPAVCIHGDIEYLYKVDLDSLSVEIYNWGDKFKNPIKKISYSNPRAQEL